MWQLPPIYDNIVMDNNHLDGRPEFPPSHLKENFKIFNLTEKMRSQNDLAFSELCGAQVIGSGGWMNWE